MTKHVQHTNRNGWQPHETVKTEEDSGLSQLSFQSTVVGPKKRTEDHYEPGTALKVKGERGIFEYRYASISRSGLVSLHLVGDHGFKAVRPEQVTVARRGGNPQRRQTGQRTAPADSGG